LRLMNELAVALREELASLKRGLEGGQNDTVLEDLEALEIVLPSAIAEVLGIIIKRLPEWTGDGDPVMEAISEFDSGFAEKGRAVWYRQLL